MQKSNNDPVLSILKRTILSTDRRLLEVGAGSGAHAVYMAPNFPQLEWHPTDLSDKLQGLKRTISENKFHTIQIPTRLDVAKDDFPKVKFDVVLTIDTLQVMHWKDCKSFFKLLGHRLREGSRAVIYGPFKYGGEFSTEAHRELDQTLKAQDPLSGIRAFEDVNNQMLKNGFELIEDYDMPESNHCLVYSRLKFVKS